jgi:hypothetical protein
MIVLQMNGHAHVTAITVEIVYPQSFPNPAYSAFVAVINALTDVVVPQFAYFAEKGTEPSTALCAILGNRLHL